MILTIANLKGGVAKSSITGSLAAMAAADGVSVVVVDAEKLGASTSWGKLRHEDSRTPAIDVVDVRGDVSKTIQGQATQYDLVIVDIGAGNAKAIASCAQISDLVLLPCGTTTEEFRKTQETFALMRDSSAPVFVLLTRVTPSTTGRETKETQELRAVFREAGLNVFDAVIPRRKVWELTADGQAIHELDNEKATQEMRAVYDEILRRIDDLENA